MGERSAVGNKSGNSVANSEPVLRRPETPPTAGRNPAARPPKSRGRRAVPATQPKSWQGCGDGVPEDIARERDCASGQPPEQSVGRGAPALDADSISRLRTFFELLDHWDREAAHETKIM